jgi:hypothetical protein
MSNRAEARHVTARNEAMFAEREVLPERSLEHLQSRIPFSS